MMKKKDEKLKIVLEHEKQARIFHANKVPQYLQLLSTTTTGTSSSSNSVKSAVCINKYFLFYYSHNNIK